MTYSALAIPRLTSSDISESAMSQHIDRRQHPHRLRRATERTLGCPYGDAPARTEAKNLPTGVMGVFAARLTARTILWWFAGRAARFLREAHAIFPRTAAYGHGIVERLYAKGIAR